MKNDIIKVIYFDENSAMDFINIVDGGKVESQTTSTGEAEEAAKLSIGAKIAANLKVLPIFNTSVDANSNVELVNQSKEVVNSTITNTILTDFIEKVNGENPLISKFDGYKAKILKDSFTYLKLYTPYTYVISDKSEFTNEIAINKLDEIMEKVKGYYEVIAKKGDDRVILRFNIACFRNNYKLTDLLKMDLNYYGIMVGKTSLNNLIAANELNVEGSIEEITVEEIVNNILGKETSVNDKNDNIKIFDVILAGVSYNDKK